MFYIYNWVYLPNTVEYVELAKAATWASCTNEFLQTVKTKENKTKNLLVRLHIYHCTLRSMFQFLIFFNRSFYVMKSTVLYTKKGY